MGHAAGQNVAVIAKNVGLSWSTVAAKVKRFTDDGRSVSDYLEACRPKSISDPNLDARRKQTRERQRAFKSRAAGNTPPLPVEAPPEAEREGLTEEQLKFEQCLSPLRNDAVRAHFARLMRFSAVEMTHGAHAVWTTEAIINRWPELVEPDAHSHFDANGLTMADVVPTLLDEWGWDLTGTGAWVNPDVVQS